jgi:AraC family ethanolamine operon transcriptional activator
MNEPMQAPRHALPEEYREVSVVHIKDPTAISDSMEVLDMDVINLDLEKFEYRQVTVPLEECCLIYQTSNAALRTRTRVHKDFDACFILGPQARGSLDGTELRPYALIAAGPGAEGDVIIDSNYENIVWLVSPQVLTRHLALRGKKGAFAIPEDHEVWHPSEEVARDLFELGTRIVEAAENNPEIFNDSRWARYGAQVEYMDALFATIESCAQGEYVDTDKKGQSYSQIVMACEAYTLDHEGRRPYLSELCAAANVSERTLQMAFKHIMGMSPLTYLHRLRLHRARHELRKANSGSTTVTDVAMNWGFWHFGEFSRAYKNCFGEVPSITLKRDSGESI